MTADANVVSLPPGYWPNLQTNFAPLPQNPPTMQITVPLPLSGETVIRVQPNGSYTVTVDPHKE